jgi:hypothetical protein
MPFTVPVPLLNAEVGGRIGGGFFVGIEGEVDAGKAPFTPIDDCIFSGRLILLIL